MTCPLITSKSTPNIDPNPWLHVVAAVIQDGQGRVLLAQRPVHLHLGGIWEFPGGKLKAGEPVAVGLARELDEELGIEVLRHRPLIRVRHRYPERRVLLDVHLLLEWRGEPQGLEGQALAWVSKEALADELRAQISGCPGHWPLPAADIPVLKALLLPERYLIATWPAAGPDAYLGRLEQALKGGISLVQFRPEAMSPDVIPELWHRVQQLCRQYQARLLCNSAWLEALKGVGLTGLHLTSRDLMLARQRPEGFTLVAASCHDPVELAQAQRLGLDCVVLSPVLPTSSHPGRQPIGWDGFAAWVDTVALPVYALGGVGGLAAAEAWQHGAQGVAGIRGLW